MSEARTEIIEREGEPPQYTLMKRNPAYDQWIERVAIRFCDPREHGASPCLSCLERARDVARWARERAMTREEG